MTQELVERLGALGQSVSMEDRVGEFPAHGVMPHLRDVLSKRFACVVGTDASGKAKQRFLCLSCDFCSAMKGVQRITEHMIFSEYFKPAMYAKWHKLDSEAQIPEGMKKILGEYKRESSNTRPCQSPSCRAQ